ncbi:MAG: hypothetical protein JWO78_2496 [Micavibrio sp.]|nr:hypothetical protein [Micavibrio sp.]
MTLSLYQASVPVFVTMLTNLSTLLSKAEAHAKAKKIDETVFMNARLAPDMLPLPRQIQIASDAAKGFTARVGGVPVPSFEDTEKTFAELQERIKKTIDFIQSVKPEQIDGGEDREVTLKLGGVERNLKGQGYLLGMALPNLFFHVTTAYGIMRHNGVEIGKMDFLGGYPT